MHAFENQYTELSTPFAGKVSWRLANGIFRSFKPIRGHKSGNTRNFHIPVIILRYIGREQAIVHSLSYFGHFPKWLFLFKATPANAV